ncbi:MAG: hypothetical protein AB1705_16165 [Verrucomicrobiota bacterium]
MKHAKFSRAALSLALLPVFLSSITQPAGAADSARWWKGNLHTHSLWSDGDDYPEMIADWYKKNGYHFLMLTDHNTLSEGERWSGVATNRGGQPALDKYVKRFGGQWVEQRTENGKLQVRLKTFEEFRTLFDEPGRFLMIQGEEVSDRYKNAPVHVNATNVRKVIKPQGGDSVLATMQNNVDAVLKQREETGQLIYPHINHPNFQWAITAEELMQVKGEKFFEVYNGHPLVHTEGDATHAGIERMWDIVLTRRLAELGLPVMYGLGTDDSHHYHTNAIGKSNSGRGWVVVRAASLTADNLIRALEAGDFYASSGVTLKDVRRETSGLTVEIAAEPGVTYTTQFIGTRKGYDPKNEPVRAASGEALRVTHRYSQDIGQVLAEVKGTSASYTFKGDEIYVRAKVTSSKVKKNPCVEGEYEAAWVQPAVPGKR